MEETQKFSEIAQNYMNPEKKHKTRKKNLSVVTIA